MPVDSSSAARPRTEGIASSDGCARLALAQAPVILWTVDGALRFTSGSGAGLDAIHVKLEHFLGKSLADVFGEGTAAETILGNHRRALAGESVRSEIEWSDRWYDTRVEPLRAADGSIVGVIGVAVDFTDRKRAEDVLRESEERFQLLSRATSDMSWDWDLVTDSIWRNERLREVFGYGAEDMEPTGTWWEQHIHPDDRERVVGTLHEAIRRGDRSWAQEYRWQRRDGTYITIVDRGYVISDRSGKPVRMVGSTADVSVQQREDVVRDVIYRISEAAVEAKDLPALYAEIHRIVGGLMPAQNFYIALYDPETSMLSFPYFVDEGEAAPAPYKAGRGLTEYVLRTGKPFYASTEGYERLVSLGEVVRIGPMSIDWVGVPLVARGKTIGVLVVQTYQEGIRFGEAERDILTYVSEQIAMAIEQRRAEEALRESEARFRTLFEAAADPILLVSRQGVILDANPAAQSLARLSKEALVGRDLGHYIPPEELPRATEYLRACFARPSASESMEITISLPDGGRRLLAVRSRLVPEPGRQPYLEMMIRDVTEQREMQRRLMESERLVSLGQMAAYVAHEINTPLANISLLAASIQRREKDPEILEKLEKLNVQRRQAAGIVSGLLSFSKQRRMEIIQVDLRDVILAAINQVEPYRAPGVALLPEMDEEPVVASVDPLQMQEVFTNLLKNALEATEYGSVTIRLSSRPHAHLVEVVDTGPGIPPEVLAHLFEPFFTTKRKLGGTGLGLALCRNIVDAHQGEIRVASGVGKGSTFTVVLPREAAR